MRRILLASSLALASGLWSGCNEDKPMLQAVKVERMDQLIGGPSAHGKLGDFLIENDKIRAVIGDAVPGTTAGMFGGTLLDLDLQRWTSDYGYGHGKDAFSETFPFANLLAINPSSPVWGANLAENGIELTNTVGGVYVLKDGSDGEAIIRVQGHSGYLFHALKFLNRGVIDGLLQDKLPLPLSTILTLAKSLFQVDLLGVLNRLQIGFDYTNDYILHEGEDFITIKTTIITSPPNGDQLANCPAINCELKCENGYVHREQKGQIAGIFGNSPIMCPTCECAEVSDGDLPVFTESTDFLGLILGSLKKWQDPTWKGGVVVGDFLYFGSQSGIFMPEIGYDYDKKINENLWQSVSTMSSPLALDWIAGTAEEVSYAMATVNPQEKQGLECPNHRIVITAGNVDAEADIIAALESYGWSKQAATLDVRTLLVDRKPIPLVTFATDQNASSYEAYLASVEELGEYKAAVQAFGDNVTLQIQPDGPCNPSKMLIPLISTAATAVLTHYNAGAALEKELDSDGKATGNYIDRARVFTATRYLSVGKGDVSSAVKPLYELRGTPYGSVSGVVFEEGSMVGIQHADVFVLRDPRANDSDPLPQSLNEYEAMAQKAFGTAGYVTQIQADLGNDTVLDGNYNGVVEPGRYLMVAHDKNRGISPFVPVKIEAGQHEVVHFSLAPEAKLTYHVVNEAGEPMPAMLTFVELDENGEELEWEAHNAVSMGEPRFDHGVALIEHTPTGDGTVSIPAGHYNIYVSRGFEYSLEILKDVEVKPNGKPISVQLTHELDTRNHVTADFHVHSSGSVDSAFHPRNQLIAAAAQGLNFLAGTDHDFQQYYEHHRKMLGLEREISTQSGVEISPLEYGHFNGYPLKYDDTYGKTGGNIPDWSGNLLWRIFEMLRERASVSEDAFVVELNHPRDGFLGFFAQSNVRPYDLERAPSMLEMCNDAIEVMPCNFNAYEVLNGKHLEFVYSSTIAEMHDYMACNKEIIKASNIQDFRDGKICQNLYTDPDYCDSVSTSGLEGEELIEALRNRDHCIWHKNFRAGIQKSCAEGQELLACKRGTFESLKDLMVRYIAERTPSEEKAYYAMRSYIAEKGENDLGCDYKKAMAGCNAISNSAGVYQSGKGQGYFCEACVCDAHPECCQSEAEGGTGWNEACAAACQSECGGCGLQPCDGHTEALDDIFALWNRGFTVTALSNSDSHGPGGQAGLPRNYVKMDSDRTDIITETAINTSVRNGTVVMSSGAYIEFTLENDRGEKADISNRKNPLDAQGSETLKAHIRVQTPSWYRVERLSIYRNGRLEKLIFIEPDGDPKELAARIVDFDEVVELPAPVNQNGEPEDSWYVVIAQSMNDIAPLHPIYKRLPYGELLTSEVAASAAESIVVSFSDLLSNSVVAGFIGEDGIEGLMSGVTMSLPNSFGPFVWGMTNPIWVDADGGGFWAIDAVDRDGDGQPDLPPFCSIPCDPSASENLCGQNQKCVADDSSPTGGLCKIPLPDYCVGTQPVGNVNAQH